MITFNGIELDYKEDALSGLVIKGGLTKIENLTDRTGTASTQFTLPRTAKNELAFGNITTEGAQTQTSGEAYITIEGNIFSKGVLYVTGYDNYNFKCLFMGQDNDLIKTLRNKPFWKLFPSDQQFIYNDANIKTALEAVIPKSLGTDISFNFANPFYEQLFPTPLSAENSAPFFSLKHLVYKVLSDEGYSMVSNFFDSDYGESIVYSDFSGFSLCHNGFENSGEQIPSSSPTATIYTYSYPNYQILDLGTALTNNVMTVSTFANGKSYQLDRNINKLKIKGQITCELGELNSAQLFIDIWNSFGVNNRYTTNQLTGVGNSLQNGINTFSLDLDYSFSSGEIITFGVFLDTNASYPLTEASIVVDRCSISYDNIAQGDAVSWADYVSNFSQLDFLKGVLKQFNLVLQIEGDKAYIELQDEGTEPIGASPASLPSITIEQYNLDSIVLDETVTDIEYLQGDLIYLKQNIENDLYIKTTQLLPYQSYGSYLYNLNTFNSSNVETVESFFNCLYDSVSRSTRDGNFAKNYPYLADEPTSWSKVLSLRFDWRNNVYDGTDNINYTNSDTTTTNIDALITWSEPVMIGKVLNGLFINTLNQKKNNKIIEVTFKDDLGTIVSNRREYIYKDQVYKIVEWSYDIIKRLVKAKLIMK